MARTAFIIYKDKHIDIYLQLIRVQMDIVWRDWVRQIVKMMALKYFFFVNRRSKAIAISFWEINTFEKVQKRVAEAALIIVLDVNYCYLLR